VDLAGKMVYGIDYVVDPAGKKEVAALRRIEFPERDNRTTGVYLSQSLGNHLNLGFTHRVFQRMQLPVDICKTDVIEIDDDHSPYTGPAKRFSSITANTPQPDNRYRGIAKQALATFSNQQLIP
jgi:hypothetical protein